MIKILLTGSNGFLGQHIAKLANPNKHIHLTGWSENRSIHDYCDDFQQVNLLSVDISAQMVEKFDVVIHTAALSQVDYCETHRNEAFRVNIEASRQLAEACLHTGTRLIHISSDFVFPGKDKLVTENDKTDPVNYYGRTKEMAELHIQNICPKSTIIRPVLIFGPTIAGTRSNLVLWVKKSLAAKQNINVTTDHFRTATYVKDLAAMTLQVAQSPNKGIYHTCGADYLSVYEMALKVAEAFHLDQNLITPVHSSSFTAQAPRPACTSFSAKKAIRDFGFKSRSFEEALSEMKLNKQ